MPSVKMSPVFQDAQLSSSTGAPLAGGLVYWYLAGTTTPAATYTDSTGSTPQANPVVLNSRGEPSLPIWLTAGQQYKAVLTDSVGNIIRTIDNISGVNDTTIPSISEWVLYGFPPSFVGTTQFSVTGDATATFTVNRRIKAVGTATVYGLITASSYATGTTTVTVALDSGVLDSGLSQIYYGFLDPTYPSINIITPKYKVGTFTRSMLAATGSVSYTGIGFKPKLLRITGNIDATLSYTNGVSDGTTNACSYIRASDSVYVSSNTLCIRLVQTGADYQQASVASFDVDGFTLAWTKIGSPVAATGNLFYEAIG